MNDTDRRIYIVVCRVPGTVANYELATRTVFETARAAEEYKSGISASLSPLVVEGRFGSLRLGDTRGQEGFWRAASIDDRGSQT